MPSDPPSVENELRQLRAAPLDEALLVRLEACADGTWTRLSAVEQEMEQRLRGIAPARLSGALSASLESVLQGVPFQSAPPKIVRFPESSGQAPRRPVSWRAAAAAVALLGAAAGMLAPYDRGDRPSASAMPSSPSPSASAVSSAPLVPAAYKRGLREASDVGVVWHPGNQPHRLLKVVYQDRVTLKDPSGRTYHVEQPRTEYILVPAKTD
jgi:hypothetical protein